MDDPASHPPPENVVLWTGLFEGGLGILAIGLGWVLGLPLARLVHWTPSAVGLGVAASLPALGAVVVGMRFRFWPFDELMRIADTLLAPLFRGCRVLELTLIAVLAGFGEEMLFRGVIQQGLAEWIGGPQGVWIGLVAASALFGAMHPISRGYLLVTTLIGFYLGWLWIVTGNLLAPIITHAVYDAVVLVYLVHVRLPRLDRRGPEETDGDGSGGG